MKPGDLVRMDDGVIDRPLLGIVLAVKESEFYKSTGWHEMIMDVQVMWDRPAPSNYTQDGIESTITWITDSVLEVISETR